MLVEKEVFPEWWIEDEIEETNLANEEAVFNHYTDRARNVVQS